VNTDIQRLGDCRVPSSLGGGSFVRDEDRILYHAHALELAAEQAQGRPATTFELAGPRRSLYFDPHKLKCGIVTCGGLCPGINDVIRALVCELMDRYRVPTVFGFRFGYQGLSPHYAHTPLELDPEFVDDIDENGGTILGSSRGPQDIGEMVDTLDRMNVSILFAIGGDGTLKGARRIAQEVLRRGLKIAVVGIPKTIDNDISYIERTFGFETAVSEARKAIYAAHIEAKSAFHGTGLVKLMGRNSGFIATASTLANSDVNFCLIPEVPFRLEGENGLVQALRRRLERRGHAVIVVAEGAGQDLIAAESGRTPEHAGRRDASGNLLFQDIGVYLKERTTEAFAALGVEISLKYIDPSYMIRSIPANADDSVFCVMLAQNAVHAGMTGRTSLIISYWNGHFIHVPIDLAVSETKKVRPEGRLWQSVLEATNQPDVMA
jgi:6-phosphofructokinase 1